MTHHQSGLAHSSISQLRQVRPHRADMLGELHQRTAGAGPTRQAEQAGGGLERMLTQEQQDDIREQSVDQHLTGAMLADPPSADPIHAPIPYAGRETRRVVQDQWEARREAEESIETEDPWAMFIIA